MARTSILPKRLQPMLATLTDGPFDDNDWIFEDKYDGFRMVARPPQCLALFSLKVKYRYPDRERHVCACSMKRRISDGQAMRLIFRCSINSDG